jgi:hypothetical protein
MEAVEVAPRGVRFNDSGERVVLCVRAGAVDWRSVAGGAISLIWTGVWVMSLLTTLHDMKAGTDDGNVGPALFVQGIATAIGLYCTLLCVWTMIGSERLVIMRGRLHMSSPWWFGGLRHSYDLRRVQPFTTQHKDCGLEGDSCCCRITNEAYPLSFGAGGHRVVVFSQLPNAAKDWIRDRMNAALTSRRGAGAPAAAKAACACACGHDHDHKHDHSHSH